MKNILSFMVIILSLTGCGFSKFVSPNKNPVIEDRIQQKTDREQIGTLALSPERRLLVTNLKNGKFCAEYPTETGLTQQSLKSFGALVKRANGNSNQINALITSMTRNQQLNRRSQSVQLFMAASYFLCQSYMNINSSGNERMAEAGLLAEETNYLNAQADLYKLAFASLKDEVQIFHESASSIPDMLKDIGYELGVLKDALGQIENPDSETPNPETPNPETPDSETPDSETPDPSDPETPDPESRA